MNWKVSGVMKAGRFSRQNFFSSLSVAVVSCLKTTQTLTRSPARSSGTPTAATSAMAGWFINAFSIASGDMFSPARMMRSFILPAEMKSLFFSSRCPRSPVLSQPSGVNVSAVSSGLFQYPRMTVSPRTRISPPSPVGFSLPDSSIIFTSTWGTTGPTDPGKLPFLKVLTAMTGEVSESP